MFQQISLFFCTVPLIYILFYVGLLLIYVSARRFLWCKILLYICNYIQICILFFYTYKIKFLVWALYDKMWCNLKSNFSTVCGLLFWGRFWRWWYSVSSRGSRMKNIIWISFSWISSICNCYLLCFIFLKKNCNIQYAVLLVWGTIQNLNLVFTIIYQFSSVQNHHCFHIALYHFIYYLLWFKLFFKSHQMHSFRPFLGFSLFFDSLTFPSCIATVISFYISIGRLNPYNWVRISHAYIIFVSFDNI